MLFKMLSSSTRPFEHSSMSAQWLPMAFPVGHPLGKDDPVPVFAEPSEEARLRPLPVPQK